MISTWPWMKDIKASLNDDPIPPVSELDQRPAVRDLIADNRKTIDKVRVAIESDPLFDPAKHDDLWILRFVLSHKKSAPSIEAAKECLAFRHKFQLDEEDIRHYQMNKPDGGPGESFFEACDKDPLAHVIPDKRRGIISFMYMKRIRQDRLLEMVSDDNLLKSLVMLSEWTFQNLDAITRTTGRLTKTFRIFECEGWSMGQMCMDQIRREGDVASIMENVYPQMLDSMVFCHAPVWAQVPWRLLRPLLPKRVVGKVDFANPRVNEKERRRMFRHISEDDLPVQFGGKNEVNPYDW